MRVLLAFLSFCFLSVRVANGADESSDITISIVLPPRSGPSVLKWSDGPKTHFHVVIRNATAKPKRIFEEWNSWGYGALSFELTDEHGVTKVARKGVKAWTMNGATSFTIPPREIAIIDVYFADRTIWGESFWLPPGHPTGRVTMKAIYEVRRDTFSKKHDVWTGKVTSAPVECLFK
jgi:hypothetical protein